MTTSNDTTQIPYGYCHCGCGQKTNLAKQSYVTLGHVIGQPMKYVVGHHRPRPFNELESFWSKVAITTNDDLCWEWQAATDRRGYGNKKWRRKYRKAHQIAWMLPNYVIPEGMFICHSCDNPKCCNPKHLFLGTPQDNVDDMIAKGRQATGEKVANRGEDAGSHKLTEIQVKDIRRLYADGNITQKQLAAQFCVGKSLIGYIVTNQIWTHIL